MPNENNPTGSPAFGAGTTSASGNAQENIDASKAHARQAAEDLRAAAQAKVDELRGKAGEYYEQARGRAEDYYDQARDRARTFQEDGEAYVRDNPLRAVLVALGAGFILGLIFRR